MEATLNILVQYVMWTIISACTSYQNGFVRRDGSRLQDVSAWLGVACQGFRLVQDRDRGEHTASETCFGLTVQYSIGHYEQYIIWSSPFGKKGSLRVSAAAAAFLKAVTTTTTASKNICNIYIFLKWWGASRWLRCQISWRLFKNRSAIL